MRYWWCMAHFAIRAVIPATATPCSRPHCKQQRRIVRSGISRRSMRSHRISVSDSSKIARCRPTIVAWCGAGRSASAVSEYLFRLRRQTTDQQLVDTEIVHIHHLKAITGKLYRIRPLWHLAQTEHHEAGNGLVVLDILERVDVKRDHHIFHWRHAVDQPGIFIAFYDQIIARRITEFSHHGVHHVL